MHNLEPQVSLQDDAARWAELVEQLYGRLDHLVSQFVGKVREVPEYAENRVAPEELLDTARETFRRLVDGLREDRLQDSGPDSGNGSLVRFAANLGAKRARAGVSGDALTAAVRLDFNILWAGLLEISDPADAGVLTARVDQVWQVVDAFATQTHSSYMSERVRMAHEESSIRREFISRLFSKSTLSAETVSQAAAALVADPNAAYAIVAASGEAAAQLRAAAAQGGWTQPSRRLYMHEIGGSTYVFWSLEGRQAGTRQGKGPAPLPEAIAAIPCGYVEEFSGLPALPAAARTAERLALLIQASDLGPLTASAAWARLAKQQLRDAGLDLMADVDEALSACRDGERERLEETVRHLLRNGNITDTAQELFCHRNTVLNRVSRFQELTGIDLTVPAQSARLVVAWA